MTRLNEVLNNSITFNPSEFDLPSSSTFDLPSSSTFDLPSSSTTADQVKTESLDEPIITSTKISAIAIKVLHIGLLTTAAAISLKAIYNLSTSVSSIISSNNHLSIKNYDQSIEDASKISNDIIQDFQLGRILNHCLETANYTCSLKALLAFNPRKTALVPGYLKTIIDTCLERNDPKSAIKALTEYKIDTNQNEFIKKYYELKQESISRIITDWCLKKKNLSNTAQDSCHNFIQSAPGNNDEIITHFLEGYDYKNAIKRALNFSAKYNKETTLKKALRPYFDFKLPIKELIEFGLTLTFENQIILFEVIVNHFLNKAQYTTAKAIANLMPEIVPPMEKSKNGKSIKDRLLTTINIFSSSFINLNSVKNFQNNLRSDSQSKFEIAIYESSIKTAPYVNSANFQYTLKNLLPINNYFKSKRPINQFIYTSFTYPKKTTYKAAALFTSVQNKALQPYFNSNCLISSLLTFGSTLNPENQIQLFQVIVDYYIDQNDFQSAQQIVKLIPEETNVFINSFEKSMSVKGFFLSYIQSKQSYFKNPKTFKGKFLL